MCSASLHLCREELADYACKTQDVAALCFALSFTKSSTDPLPEGASTATRSQYWRETHLSPLHEAAAVGTTIHPIFLHRPPPASDREGSLATSLAQYEVRIHCPVDLRSHLQLTWNYDRVDRHDRSSLGQVRTEKVVCACMYACNSYSRSLRCTALVLKTTSLPSMLPLAPHIYSVPQLIIFLQCMQWQFHHRFSHGEPGADMAFTMVDGCNCWLAQCHH